MDKIKSRIRSTHPGVLPKRKTKLRVGSRKLSQEKKQKTNSESSESGKEDKVSKGTVKENDSMETTVLVVFWGIMIVIAEIVKWVAAFHFVKHLPFVKALLGGGH